MSDMPANGGDDRIKALVGEVEALRGAGLYASAPPSTPELRRLLDIPDHLSDAEAFPLIRFHVIQAASLLPPELAPVFLTAAGADAGAPTGSDARKALAAEASKISARTVLRWCQNKAAPMIVDLLRHSEHSPADTPEIEVLRLYAGLDFTETEPRLIMRRRIRLLAPSLQYFNEEMHLPRLDGRPFCWRALDGCTVDGVTALGHNSWSARITFPRSLRQGEVHSFATTVQLPSHDAMLPVLGFRPHSTTRDVTIELNFGKRLPSRIEIFQTTSPQGVPEAHIERELAPKMARWARYFPYLRLGYSSGVRWFFDESSTAA